MQMVKNTFNRITSMIKRGVLTLPIKDGGINQISQVSYLGKAADVTITTLYGLCSSPPVGSTVLLLNVQGQEENRAGFADFPGARFKNLKSGEVAVGNYVTKSNVTFLENGDIQVTGKNNMIVNITNDDTVTIGGSCTVNIATTATVNVGTTTTVNCPDNIINGNLIINGNFTVNGESNSTGNFITTQDVIASGISLNSHTHGGVQTGGGNTGGPQ